MRGLLPVYRNAFYVWKRNNRERMLIKLQTTPLDFNGPMYMGFGGTSEMSAFLKLRHSFVVSTLNQQPEMVSFAKESELFLGILSGDYRPGTILIPVHPRIKEC